jgi:hypothetical protein
MFFEPILDRTVGETRHTLLMLKYSLLLTDQAISDLELSHSRQTDCGIHASVDNSHNEACLVSYCWIL